MINIVVVATVLTACGIETSCQLHFLRGTFGVATVLTACGIETTPYWEHLTMLPPPLQQYLPFTVFNRIYDKTPRRLI